MSYNIGIISVGIAFLNTFVRLTPVALYTGSAMSGFVFDDFRGTILFMGFLINEAIAYGYRMILQGVYNPQCSLMKTEEDYFVLPSPITQTYGFFYGFVMGEMYEKGLFSPTKFFIMTAVFMLIIYSRVNVGCKTVIDASYCSILGSLLGLGYYYIVKTYYSADYVKLSELDTSSLFDSNKN